MLQLLISGIVFGSIYALLAMAFNIIYRVARVVNFAQGDIMTVAAFVGFTVLVTWKLPVWVMVPVAVGAAVIVAGLIDWLAVRPVWRFGGRSSENHNWVLSTFGAAILLQNIFQRIWGTFEVPAPAIFGREVHRIFGAGISNQQIGIVAVAVLVFLGVNFLNERTLFGRSSEAIAEKPDVASLMGINTSRVVTYSWLLAGAVSGIAGVMVAPLLVLGPAMGFIVAIKAFVAMIIGGLGNPRGAIIAGFAIGIYEGIIARWIPGGFIDVFTLLLLVAFLYFKPSGLFGRGDVVRA